MARLKLGLDAWECSCGAIIAMGRLCGCGKCYADILRENSGIREKKKEVKKAIREPGRTGKFFKSFCFKKEN
jgi:hypothetical protein